MSLLHRAAERVLQPELETIAEAGARLRETNTQLGSEVVVMKERLAELEAGLEREGWQSLGDLGTNNEFSREGLRKIVRQARLAYLKNPLIRRGVDVQADYVFGQGVSVQAHDKVINTVLQTFWDDESNQAELTEHQQLLGKERTLSNEGNLFFAFFINRLNGRVQVRTFDVDQIEEIITNPEDEREIWFYKRTWTSQSISVTSGAPTVTTHTRYYPDWRYQPLAKDKLFAIGSHLVEWDVPIYHVKTGGLSNWRFGVPETYAALDWAKAYKEFLEHRATVAKALARFAWKQNAPDAKGARGLVNAIKDGSAAAAANRATYGYNGHSSGPVGNGDPSSVPGIGDVATMTPGHNLDPVKTAGATINPDEGRRFALMAFSALGLAETFFGDVSVGTLATAESLDRPTELKMSNRQLLWTAVLLNIARFVLFHAVKAPQGPLRGLGHIERDPSEPTRYRERVKWNAGIDPHADADFPAIIQTPTSTRIQDIIAAAANIPDGEFICRLLLIALGINDVDEVLAPWKKQGLFDQVADPDADPDDDDSQPDETKTDPDEK